jgi:hypothetical protein
MLIDMTDITLSNFTTVLSKRAKREAARTKAQENPKQELYLKLSPLPRNKKTSAAAVPSIVSAADPSIVAPSIEVPFTTADPRFHSNSYPLTISCRGRHMAWESALSVSAPCLRALFRTLLMVVSALTLKGTLRARSKSSRGAFTTGTVMRNQNRFTTRKLLCPTNLPEHNQD